MEKYIKLDWPASQDWMDCEAAIWAAEAMALFVPEELYNNKMAR